MKNKINEEEANLIIKYEAYIYKIAKRFYNVELEDLIQAGVIGLIKASRNFDSELGTNFMTYPYMSIFGEMYELANKSRDIKINKHYAKVLKEINQAKQELTQELNKTPTLTERCLYADLDQREVAEVINTTTDMLRLDDEYSTISGEVTLKDCIGYYENIEDKLLVRDSIDNLEPLEQSVIDYRYFHDLTQTETADILGISQVKVSRVENKSMKKIKEYIVA